MKIIKATIFALKIPFVESFQHAAKTRIHSDSIVVRLLAEDGTVGYGEGVPRPYVTGETVESCLEIMKTQFWPAVMRADYPKLTGLDKLIPIHESLNEVKGRGVISSNAARTAFELAVIDSLLVRQSQSFSTILFPKRDRIIYSGVITSGSKEKMVEVAKRYRALGVKQLKVKIDGGNDRSKLLAIREVVGDATSLRVDANGALDFKQAISILNEITEARIDCVEQPLPRGKAAELALLKAEVSIPIMVDESLVTIEDAKSLIAAGACDFFNLRISKCGGIYLTLQLARIATEAGIKIQLGAQVGETAILSAAGRHVSAFFGNLEFVEGSFGTMLLTEDVAVECVNFSQGGGAPLLHGEGLGIHVRDEVLKKYAVQVIECGRNP